MDVSSLGLALQVLAVGSCWVVVGNAWISSWCWRRSVTMVAGGCFRIDRVFMRGFLMSSKALCSKLRKRASFMVRP